MDGPARLEVWRGNRLRLAGSPPELLAAAQRGALRHDDRVRVPENGATFRPHEVPFLAPHVPSRLEASTRRSLRVLYAVDAILLPIAALFVAALWAEDGMAGVRNALLPLFLVVVFFVAPIPALRARLGQLRAMRARGYLPDEGADRPTTGDARLDAVLARRPVVTHVAVGVIVAVSLVAPPGSALWLLLAKTNDGVAGGEWWRLVTPLLVHGGLLHLGVNMLALANVGPAVENLYGRIRLVAILFVGTVGATLGSFWFTRRPDVPSVGASGGLFALVGALLVFGLRHRDVLAAPARDRLVRGMLWVVAVNLAIGFTATFIDNAAHIGGLVTGAALGAVLPPAAGVRRILLGRRSVRPSTGSGRTE
ncbi:MAG TPA: rhomboid family intramembrane serine protease [Anaeromyxobacteraceae bacterium]|nr:rhomboid family intramembrane serine protease [Anaeromyxobacteraceae bacterium]